MNDTKIPLYSRISLNRDFPACNLRRGDIATFIDIVPDPEGIEEGYIIEVFNALGESMDVVTVPKSAVEPLRSDDVPSVRSLEPRKVSSRTRMGRLRRYGTGRKLIVLRDAKGRTIVRELPPRKPRRKPVR